jgi:dienelactone hydrolase
MPTHPVLFTVRRETRLRWGRERSIELRIGKESVAGVLLLPDSTSPMPAALLLHGLSSHKERMSDTVGRSLLRHGVASLALDLPMHGERAKPGGRNAFSNPLALVGAWRAATNEASHATAWLRAQPEIDADRIGVIGYSLGGFLAIMTAADEPHLKVVLLAAAGDLPDATPYASIVRGIVDPLRAAKRLAGRPLMLVNGTRDTTTRPAQAQRLHDAADEPIFITWYEGGHWPPAAAIESATAWFATALTAERESRVERKPKRAG